MPELPEVETIRRDLEVEVTGRTITRVECAGGRCIRRHADPQDFIDRLEGAKITAVDRRGKYLMLRLDGDAVLVVHLGMSGQLLRVPAPSAAEPRAKHTHVILALEDAGELRYVDPRTFGELFVTTGAVEPLQHLGIDAVDETLTARRLAGLLAAKRTKLKPLLLDQGFLAGIGNIYADEILWKARLRFDRAADSLTAAEVRRLHKAMVETLHDAIRHRGSSLADAQYRDAYGVVGDYQSRHNAYDREGRPCPRCRTPIVRLKWQGRSSFLCPRCQA